MSLLKKFAVATIALVAVFTLANTASAVMATEIYTPTTGYLTVGSGMGAKTFQMPNVIAAQTALNACVPGTMLVLDGKFGPLTKGKFVAFQASQMIAQDGVIGPITAGKLAACSGNPTPTPTPTTGLEGGAGDLNISTTSTDVEDTAKEGEEDVKILGFKAEADGSDIAVTSLKVSFKNTGYASSSENFTKYVDEVTVWVNGKNVGSADAEDFTRDSGTPDEYSKTISLSGAVIREGDEPKVYVAISAVSSIDSDDMAAAAWDVQVDTIRFNDATGAILSADVDDLEYADNDSFSFEDISEGNDLALKSSSANPDDSTVKVEEDDASDETLALVVKLDNDEDSSDADLLDIPVRVTIDNYGTDATTADDVIDSVTLTVGGKDFDGDLSGAGTLDVDGTTAVVVTYNFDIDGDVTVDAGDTEDVKVNITFHDQDGNYAQDTLVTAAIHSGDISAETSDDEIDVTGSTQTGATLTLNTSAAVITNEKWVVSSTGTILDFFFTVKAEDEDFDVLAADITDSASGTATITDTSGTPETTTKGILTRYSGDTVTAISTTGFTVSEGDTTTFRVRYNLTPGSSGANNGLTKEVTITSVAGQEVDEDTQVSPTATINV